MIVAAADAAQHDAPMPPMVAAAVQYGGHLENGGLDMPAGLPLKLRYYHNVFRAFEAYQASAGNSVAWTKANPQAWDLVTSVIAMRKERRNG